MTEAVIETPADVAPETEDLAARMLVGVIRNPEEAAAELVSLSREVETLKRRLMLHYSTEGLQRMLTHEAIRKINMLRFKYKQQKASTAALKKQLEEEIAKHFAALEEEALPLYTGYLGQAGTTETNGHTEKPAEAEPADWRDTPIPAALGTLPPSVIKALADNDPPLTTMGKLADWTKESRLIDIKGIGTGKAEQIEEACQAFWAKRSENGQASA